MRTLPGDIVSLRDGSEARIRRVGPADADALLEFMRSLSSESRRLCCFTAGGDVEAAARSAAAADGVQQIGLVAVDSEGQVLGHAMCVRLYGPRAEVVVEVDEHHHHLGLAILMLRRLAHEAERQGIRRLIAEVLPQDHDMLAVLDDDVHASGSFEDGEVDVEFPSSATHLPPERPA